MRIALCVATWLAVVGCGSGGAGPMAGAASLPGFDAGALGDANTLSSDAAPADSGDATPLGPDAVVGMVVDIATGRALVGRTVTIGAESAMTDLQGRFVFGRVSPAYDAMVVDPDGSAVTLYQGVRRRDPILSHRPSHVPDVMTRSANVSGNLSGGAAYPLDRVDVVTVYFFAPQVDQHVFVGGLLAPALAGPAYGPVRLAWNGADSIHGRVFALGSFDRGDDAGNSAWIASQVLDVSDGQDAGVNLAFAPASSDRIAGRIEIPAGSTLGFKQVAYRLPIANGIVALVNEETSAESFDYVIPDLGSLGGTLCVTAGSSSPFFLTLKCGARPGASDVIVVLQSPPSLSTPGDGAMVAKGAQFSWTRFDGGVHELTLDAEIPSRNTPSISVFTSATSTSWPDLASIGTPFPADATYRCAIGGAGLYATMDDALGPDGLSAPMPSETRRANSPPIHVRTAP